MEILSVKTVYFQCTYWAFRTAIQRKPQLLFALKLLASVKMGNNATEFGKNSFFYQTIKIWNCLPIEVKYCSSEKAFALKIRDILVRCRSEMFVNSEEARIINHLNCLMINCDQLPL
jgi:hypothetical protein